jgi:hypothetical protein
MGIGAGTASPPAINSERIDRCRRRDQAAEVSIGSRGRFSMVMLAILLKEQGYKKYEFFFGNPSFVKYALESAFL